MTCGKHGLNTESHQEGAHNAVELRHSAAQVRSLLLKRQVERVLQDVLIIHSHKELAVWTLVKMVGGKTKRRSPTTSEDHHPEGVGPQDLPQSDQQRNTEMVQSAAAAASTVL